MMIGRLSANHWRMAFVYMHLLVVFDIEHAWPNQIMRNLSIQREYCQYALPYRPIK